MNNKVRSPETPEFTFETQDQLAEFMGLPSTSSVVRALWNDLKANETTDQDIVETMQIRRG